MVDLNYIRVFERVASLRSFSAAGRTLSMPRSSVSRSIQRLETELSTRLLQRTTREVELTEAGQALYEQCADLLSRLDQCLEFVGSLSDGPRGCLRVSAGIAFGVNVLSQLLPGFTLQYPNVTVVLDLSSIQADLVSDRIDVAIRLGKMPDSEVVAKRLGAVHRYLCASPEYLARRGVPETPEDLRQHDLIDFHMADGRMLRWQFARDGQITDYRQHARIAVNDALTIHKILLNGAGVGLSSGYLCVPEFSSGRLVRLLPDWSLPPTHVHAVFPSHRELSPIVRAFIDYLRDNCRPGQGWQSDPLAEGDDPPST